MATLQVLQTAYSDVLRTKISNISTADQAILTTYAQQVDAGTLSLTDARTFIGKMALSTTSVANLSYAFFVGVTPSSGGLDYLVSTTGGNTTNLNSTYYSAFSAENRYINFSVALGKGGAGAARFNAAYGALDLAAAATKAYTEIFGFAPAAGKITEILTAVVPNGQGGTFTRADYFAAYGQDGSTGLGTKAAMVGWLLSEAAKADLGVYAKANDALLADIANDGQAAFNVDLLGVYGPQPTFAVGATIAATSAQSVAPDATTVGLRSTGDNDTVTGTDSNASQSISTAGGHDTITLTGVVGGLIDGGDGNDTINLGTLSAPVVILGGGLNGQVNGGAGNDKITITNVANGAIIDGGAGDDTLVIGTSGQSFANTKITNVEHLVLKDFNITTLGGGTPLSGVSVRDYTGLKDITVRSGGATVVIDQIANGTLLKMEGANASALIANYFQDLVIVGQSSTRVGATSVHTYIDGVTAGGNLTVTGNDGALYLHVQNESVIGMVHTEKAGSGGGAIGNIVVQGTGRLTAGFDTANLDASASAGVTATRIGLINNNTVTDQTFVLSGAADLIKADLGGYGKQTYTLGAGADVFGMYQVDVSTARFANLQVDAGKVTTMATITDFAKSVDRVDLGVGIASVTGGVSVGAATTLEQALITASNAVAANGTGVFEYNGDTYIYHQDATVGVNTGDGLIKLAGVVGLTIGTGATVADIHYG
jgi:hypothetical protein